MFKQKSFSKIIPLLDKTRHKGQNGKIASIGGSFEYTGAPYYAAISALKGGGDLAYIFCTKSAAIPIKSYSPECIVYPYLLEEGEYVLLENAVNKLVSSTSIMHSLVIGPGLGREQITGRMLENLFQKNNSIKILDADALWHISQKPNKLIAIIQEKSDQFILTPNAMEVKRLLEYFDIQYIKPDYDSLNVINDQDVNYKQIGIENGYPGLIAELSRKLNNVIIVSKGQNDIITNGKVGYAVNLQGSQKRCGGQGDILSGLIGLYSYWSQEQEVDKIEGCILGSVVTRRAANLASNKEHYSLTTPKIIDHIGEALYSIVTDQ
ncbi:unnamed protein product (macronuclear) [Paramecium tetraurelia]|uniref:ATP-dependent (S)-NAD(P)H-hydrate dehydratase n=1 Tax=Paramecium tetraurelia TaxID=5888 RepID=A0D4P4_PARTE|nr:uncharacterized protein GSPATT00013458001 [Paramecium tetraurelia]CAK78011.1 unnamed protein product [Paramecium tetraurelia]|eukprot:XP_001445408.1 hypothetical protein (macronuclear) [Paramecium tetraurelia strain d4-2]